MIPPTFQIGDEVLIIGPTITGCKLHAGEKFTISQEGNNDYTGRGYPWYPASSLQLVNKKPLSPMHITYNYKPDDCEHGTIQVSCPCGRKAEIDPNWPELGEELKIGDYVEVIGPCLSGYTKIADRFRISQKEASEEVSWYSTEGKACYPATSLRKLTPDEITKHLAPKSVSPKPDWEVMIMQRVVDSEKRLTAIEKRLDFVEKIQLDQTRDALCKDWRAGP